MCKTEVADSAFADCRRLSDIEYGQWDFSDTEDIYISDAPMRKMRRPFFRIKVKLDIENPIIRINTAFKGCSSLEKISVLPRIYHN